MDKRAEVQRQMTIRQIAEVNDLIMQLRGEIKEARQLERQFVFIRVPTASLAMRNLEDLKKRFLEGLVN